MPQGSDEKGVSVCGIYSLQLMRMPMVESVLKMPIQCNLSTKAMLGVKSFDPCREFGCFQSLFFIVVDHCVPFTLAVVKSQVVLRSPFVERFHCIGSKHLSFKAMFVFFVVSLDVLFLLDAWKAFYLRLSLH